MNTTHQLYPSTHRYILGMRVDATNYKLAVQQIVTWAKNRQSKAVYAANVHMTMETYDDRIFANIVNSADIVAPDGKPLVWALRALGIKDATQVYGPDLTLETCQAAAREGIAIALYGGTPASLVAFTQFLHQNFPGIQIVSQISPPFRPLTPAEDAAYTQEIVASRAQILFVGIGCPRQEIWIANHKDKIPAVMLGVGAAFDFHSGRVKQAPNWMRKIGMEWFFRLVMEPRRLWKRYFKHNPRFVWFFLMQWLAEKGKK